jgi:aldose 1-epimerase
MSVTKEAFGGEYTLYTITNENGMQARVTDLGGTLVSLLFQDKNENMRDVVLGYDTPEEYKKNGFFFGAWVGRSGNRIDKAKFELNGKTYQLAVNDNENNLHSGMDYFHLRKAEVAACSEDSVTFEIKDGDLQQGYPGSFTAQVTYTLTDDNTLKLTYRAKSDQDTVCNMTNHTYFNLGGHDSGSITDTQLCLNCKAYTPVIDSQSIPTGEIRPVEGTPFDFTAAKTIGRDIGADDEQLKFVGGYDHNFVIAKEKGTVVKFAEAYQPKTGICMECYSDLPGVQLYVGNFITPHTGKGGAAYDYRNGFCLETQYYPNSINQEGFAKPILKAGEEFTSVTCYKFSVK